MTFQSPFGQPLLTFPELDKSPLSIRAKALVFIDPRSQQLRQALEAAGGERYYAEHLALLRQAQEAQQHR